jgi:hypothetical protein
MNEKFNLLATPQNEIKVLKDFLLKHEYIILIKY